MNVCIICRKETTIFSDEHVIPDALGGRYHIKTVCKDCNDYLGKHVDSPLVNHCFSEAWRNMNAIPGKKKKIQHPFKNKLGTLKDDPNQRFIIETDSSGNITPRLLYNKQRTEKPDGSLTSTITIDKQDEKDLEKIMMNERKNLAKEFPDKQIICEPIQCKKSNPVIHVQETMNMIQYKIGLLKIAYEFAVDCVPEYFSDESAIKISNILCNAEYSKIEDFYHFDSLGNSEILEKFIKPFPFINVESEKEEHYLILFDLDEGLCCLVVLHYPFRAFIQLSSKKYISLDNSLIDINNYKNKIFEKISLIEFLERELK